MLSSCPGGALDGGGVSVCTLVEVKEVVCEDGAESHGHVPVLEGIPDVQVEDRGVHEVCCCCFCGKKTACWLNETRMRSGARSSWRGEAKK